MGAYVIAIRRGGAPVDFAERLSDIPGLIVKDSGTRRRAVVEGDQEAVTRLRSALGDDVIVEPVSGYRTS